VLHGVCNVYERVYVLLNINFHAFMLFDVIIYFNIMFRKFLEPSRRFTFKVGSRIRDSDVRGVNVETTVNSMLNKRELHQ
jgi:hypothetical protein